MTNKDRTPEQIEKMREYNREYMRKYVRTEHGKANVMKANKKHYLKKHSETEVPNDQHNAGDAV